MKTKKKRSLFRKLLKVFLVAAAIFVLLSIAALIVLRIQYPPEKVKQLIENELSSALNNRSVTIESANLNILKGFGFDNLIVYNHPDTSSKMNAPADSSKFIFIKKTFLNYDLLSLLRRNVKIRTIEIDHPAIYYTSHHDKTNIDDMLVPSTEDTVEVIADTSEADVSLPISFELDKFEFKHFDAYLTITTDTSSLYAEISDFSIYMTDLELPRGEWMDVRDSLRAKARIESPESAWKIRLENPALSHPYQIESLFDLDIDLSVDGIRSVNAAGSAGMGDVMITENVSKRIPASKLFHLQFDLNLNAQQGDVDISELELDLADEKLFAVKGSGKNLYEQPYLDVRVENSEIRLSKIFSNVKSIVPSEYENVLQDISIDGILSFKNTKIRGSMDSTIANEGFVFTTVLDLSDFSLSYPDPETRIDSLSIHVEGTGNYSNAGFYDGNLTGQLKIASVYSALNDTLQIEARNTTADLTSAISPEFFPTNLRFDFNVQDIFDSSLDFMLSFESFEKLEDYKAGASLEILDFDLENVPNSTDKGRIETLLTLESQRLDSVALNLSVHSDSVFIPMENGEMALAPMNIAGTGFISTDQKFEDYSIQNLKLTGNDFINIAARGALNKFGENGFEFIVDSAFVKHKELFAFIPALFKTGIESLKVDGSSKLTAKINGKIPANNDMIVDASSELFLQANVDYSEVPLGAQGITATLNIFSDGKSVSGDLWATMDSLLLSDVRAKALRYPLMQANFHLPDFTRAILDSAWIEVPDLQSRLIVNGVLDSLDAVPVIKLDGKFTFNSDDHVLLIDDLYLNGRLESDINMYFKQPLFSVNGDLQASSLKARYSDLVNVDNISARIPFNQKINIDQALLINEPDGAPLFADKNALNYFLMRPYYINDGEIDPFIKIEKIRMMDYQVSNVDMDVHLGDGRIDLSRIALNLYGGNLIGNMHLDFGSGQLEAVNYYVKANVSRLNSARLSPASRGSARESELNLNMEFSGTGIDLQEEIDVLGFLYITKIGSRFTDNVLNSLDPQGTDKSIQGTKRLLRWGYKPRLISFEIKHGYLYPSIHLTKGNFLTKLIPLNLSGGRIELARMPIKFFVNMAMAQAQ